MGIGDSRYRSRNIIITASVFLIGFLCWSIMLQDLYSKRMAHLHEHYHLDAVVFADEIQQDFAEGEGVVRGLAMSVSNNPEHTVQDFDHEMHYVTNQVKIPIDSVQLMPGAVVSKVYPESKRGLLGRNVFDEPKHELALQSSLQTHEPVVIGPFESEPGESALAITMPVFLDVGTGEAEQFWGFTSVTVKLPATVARTVTHLENAGMAYRLEKTGFGYSGYVPILESAAPPVDPVGYTFSYGGCQWRMQLAPRNGWQVMGALTSVIVLGLAALFMLTALTYLLLLMRSRQKRLRCLAMTDPLTGLLNRHGLEAAVQKEINRGKLQQALFVQLDIDDFKLINDIFGHQIGDETLRHLAVIMRVFFPREAILSRNGGDEFIIVLPMDDLDAAERMVRDFVSLKKEFNYKQMVYRYTISVGYAIYSAVRADGKAPLDVLRDADAALYTVKLRGKNGCCRYAKGMAETHRVQMGFSLRDLAFNLPAAVLIYDAESERILFANQKLIALFECEDLDDFLAFTDHSFRGTVHPDDYERVDTSIWQQVYDRTGHGHKRADDSIRYRIITKHGRVHWVIDRGHLVENAYYGRIFYVILIPDEQMEKRSDKTDRR